MRRPLISVNLALSADGKISSTRFRPSGWTSPQDHERLVALRREADALLVGRGTLESDRMTLTAPGRLPLRCVVSTSGNFDFSHPLFHTPGGPIHLLVTGPSPLPAAPSGVTVRHGTLREFLGFLALEQQVGRLHCEGGGTLVRSLAQEDLIDTLFLTLGAHTLFGGEMAPTATGVPGRFLPASIRFQLTECHPLPDTGECFLCYQTVR